MKAKQLRFAWANSAKAFSIAIENLFYLGMLKETTKCLFCELYSSIPQEEQLNHLFFETFVPNYLA